MKGPFACFFRIIGDDEFLIRIGIDPPRKGWRFAGFVGDESQVQSFTQNVQVDMDLTKDKRAKVVGYMVVDLGTQSIFRYHTRSDVSLT